MAGLKEALDALKLAGCTVAYVDGSFVTTKRLPADFDGCWDITGVDPTRLDLVFLDFSDQRAAQKARFLGEIFPAQIEEAGSGRRFLEFFQINRQSGDLKGIVAIDLRGLP